MERMVVLDPLDRFVAIMEHVSHSGKIPGAGMVNGSWGGMWDWQYFPHRRALDELASLISHIGCSLVTALVRTMCGIHGFPVKSTFVFGERLWSIDRLATRPNLVTRGVNIASDLFPIPLVHLVSLLRGFNSSGLRFLNFFNDPRIIREQRIAAYKGYRKKRGGASSKELPRALFIALWE
ncbi:hypothetical protein Tco_1203790 [Tanacetum coccineum]